MRVLEIIKNLLKDIIFLCLLTLILFIGMSFIQIIVIIFTILICNIFHISNILTLYFIYGFMIILGWTYTVIVFQYVFSEKNNFNIWV